MKWHLLWQVGALLCLCVLVLYAGQVRDIRTNDKVIQTIHLSMGQSTILRFKEKPKKVVVGNANYMHIEFINNDLAIQPLSSITTNLFVYADFGRTYGFKLKVVGHGSHYDDLVNVKWKPQGGIRIQKKKRKRKALGKKLPKQAFKQKLKFSKILVTVDSISRHKGLDLLIVDLKIQNVSGSSLNLKPLKVELMELTQKDKKEGLFHQFVKDLVHLKKGTTTQARIVSRPNKQSKSFILKMDFQGESRKTLISKR